MESVSFSDVEILLDSSNCKKNRQPTNADLMNFLEKMNANLAANNLFKALVTKRLDSLETKTNDNTNKITQLKTQIASIKSDSSHSQADVWVKQRKLCNNINIIGIQPSNGEILTNIVLNIFIFYGLSITAADIETIYRVKYARSNMIIVKFNVFDVKLNLINAKKNKKLTIGDIPSVDGSIANSSKEIFINPHVPPFVGRLLYRGRTAVKDKKIVAYWMSANSLLVKVNNESDPVMIKSMSDFEKILGQSETSVNEPASIAVGKRRSNEISPSINETQPKSKPRTTSHSMSSFGPLSMKNKTRSGQKEKK